MQAGGRLSSPPPVHRCGFAAAEEERAPAGQIVRRAPCAPRYVLVLSRHAAAAGLLPRCTLVRFAGYRCVRFFCSFVAAVRSTPSGEAVEGVGARAP